jgi:hypothetical protein
VVVQLFFSILISDFSLFFSSIFSKAANISHQAQRLGANIFQGPQTFLIRREHFSKAANISHQAQRFGANIFQGPQTFLIKRKG